MNVNNNVSYLMLEYNRDTFTFLWRRDLIPFIDNSHEKFKSFIARSMAQANDLWINGKTKSVKFKFDIQTKNFDNFYVEYKSDCGYKWATIIRFDDTNWTIVG